VREFLDGFAVQSGRSAVGAQNARSVSHSKRFRVSAMSIVISWGSSFREGQHEERVTKK
jgi:hypothetical protein